MPATKKTAPAPRQIVQMTQQQQRRGSKPVIFRTITETVVVTDRGIRLHLLALDDAGALWERWSDLPEGAWHEVERPQK